MYKYTTLLTFILLFNAAQGQLNKNEFDIDKTIKYINLNLKKHFPNKGSYYQIEKIENNYLYINQIFSYNFSGRYNQNIHKYSELIETRFEDNDTINIYKNYNRVNISKLFNYINSQYIDTVNIYISEKSKKITLNCSYTQKYIKQKIEYKNNIKDASYAERIKMSTDFTLNIGKSSNYKDCVCSSYKKEIDKFVTADNLASLEIDLKEYPFEDFNRIANALEHLLTLISRNIDDYKKEEPSDPFDY